MQAGDGEPELWKAPLQNGPSQGKGSRGKTLMRGNEKVDLVGQSAAEFTRAWEGLRGREGREDGYGARRCTWIGGLASSVPEHSWITTVTVILYFKIATEEDFEATQHEETIHVQADANYPELPVPHCAHKLRC